jgi:hypothetical protein
MSRIVAFSWSTVLTMDPPSLWWRPEMVRGSPAWTVPACGRYLYALREAGLEPGDRVVARAEGAGRVVLEREHEVLGEFAGVLTGTYDRDELQQLRDEWR